MTAKRLLVVHECENGWMMTEWNASTRGRTWVGPTLVGMVEQIERPSKTGTDEHLSPGLEPVEGR